jgi:hypothetical protein
MAVFGMLRSVAWLEFAADSDVLTLAIIGAS